MTIRQEAIRMINSMPDDTVNVPVELLKQMIKNDGISLIAGLWKDHDNMLTVDETVRDMRKGMTFILMPALVIRFHCH